MGRSRLLGLGQSFANQCLSLLLIPLEMIFPSEALGLELVHILRAGGAGGEPALLGDDFQSAD